MHATSSLSIPLSVDILGCFHVLTIVNSAAVNIGWYVSFMNKSGISGSYENRSFFTSIHKNKLKMG